MCAYNPLDQEALKQNIHAAVETFSNVNLQQFPEVCLKELRHVSQQKMDILNIFYDGEYNNNYYILLISNKKVNNACYWFRMSAGIFLGR